MRPLGIIGFVALTLFATFTAGLSAAEIEIGAAAPDFSATGVDGEEYSLKSFGDAKAIVVCFTCNSCPVAMAYEERMIALVERYRERGMKLIAVNCNNLTENLEAMAKHAADGEINYPYACDATGAAARAFGARVTPHYFVLDGDRRVVYRGAFDDDMRAPKTHYVADAVTAVLAGKKPETASTKPFGCGLRMKRE